MRTVTTTETIYKFAELPTESAKDRARDWLRSCAEVDDITRSILEPIQTAAQLLGITIGTRRGTQSEIAIWWDTNPIDGGFDGDWSSERRPVCGFGAAIRAEFPTDAVLHSVADRLDAAALANKAADPGGDGYAYAAVSTHSRSMSFVDVRVSFDESTEDTIRDAVRAFSGWIGTLANSEAEHQSSNDYIDDMLTANNYEFTGGGEFYT